MVSCLVILSESASGVTVAIIEAAFAAKLTWKVAEYSRNGTSTSASMVSDSFWLLQVAVIKWDGQSCLCSPLKMNSTVVETLEGRTGEEESQRKKTHEIDHGTLSALPIPRIWKGDSVSIICSPKATQICWENFDKSASKKQRWSFLGGNKSQIWNQSEDAESIWYSLDRQ